MTQSNVDNAENNGPTAVAFVGSNELQISCNLTGGSIDNLDDGNNISLVRKNAVGLNQT